MRVIDAHCDVLWRIWNKKFKEKTVSGSPFYEDADWLQVTKKKLERGNVGFQACAIYTTEEKGRHFQTALEMVDIFYNDLVSDNTIVLRSYEDLQAWKNSDQLGLVLAIEGAESIEGDLVKLYTLYRLGVRWIGLTHNPANEVADGVGEARGAGLSNFGLELIPVLNELKIGIDVSHLSERGFWDVHEHSKAPYFASHSNAKCILPHRRNLTDEQIKAIISKDGLIGLTFVPYFTSDKETVTIADLLRHLDHICSLGGGKHVGFGSDFDGISKTIQSLENSGDYENLTNELLKAYSEDQVKGFLGENWYNLLVRLWK